jgi:hypothetical protein
MSHITEIETMVSRLSDVGAAMSDIQIMTKIICTLPPSYRNFATVWDSMSVNQRTISILTTRLLKDDSSALWWSRGQQDAADTAFFAQNYHSSANSSGLNHSRGNQGRRGRSDQGGAARRYNSARYWPFVKCTYCAKDWHTHEESLHHKYDESLAKSRQDDAAAAVPYNTQLSQWRFLDVMLVRLQRPKDSPFLGVLVFGTGLGCGNVRLVIIQLLCPAQPIVLLLCGLTTYLTTVLYNKIFFNYALSIRFGSPSMDLKHGMQAS